MSDWTRLPYVAWSLAVLSAFILLYVVGGRAHRVLRWLVGGGVFAGGCLVLVHYTHTLHVGQYLSVLAYPAALNTGYGADQVGTKIRLRARYGLFVGLAAGTLLVPAGKWLVWLFQLVLAVVSSVFFGVLNPETAVGEEGTISGLMVLTVPFALIP